MIDLHPRHRSVLLDLLREKAAAEEAGFRAPAALFPPGTQIALARALRNHKPFLLVVGGPPSQTARAVDESLQGLHGRVHVARAAAQQEAPLTLAILLERVLDRPPGTLRSSNLESAFSAVTRHVAGAKIDRVLVIDEAEHTPRDLLGHLAFLTTLLGSNGLSLKVILLGARQSLKRCVPAGVGSDVIDLDTSLLPPANAPGQAPLPASLPPSKIPKPASIDGNARRYRVAVVLGPLFLATGVSAAAYLTAWNSPHSGHDRSGAASPGGNAVPLAVNLARPSAEPAEASAAFERAPPAELRENQHAPAPPSVIPSAASALDAPLSPAPHFAETPRPVPAPEPAAAGSERALPAAMIETLMRRGHAALADGDVVTARLLFERAASSSAAAALALGKTYDPDFLAQLSARGVQPDRAAAVFWYEKARAMGDRDAAEFVNRLRATLQH